MVPMEDPVAVEMMQTARKVNAVNIPPPTPSTSASQTKPDEIFVVLISWEKIPMTNSRTAMGTASFTPSYTAFEYDKK